jgi:hypothetical protein
MKNIPSEVLSIKDFNQKFAEFEAVTTEKLPSQMALEANVMIFPLVSFKGDDRRERIWKREIRDNKGQIETFQELKFFAPGNLKLANGIIDRKLQILAFHLWQKYGSQEDGMFWFTLRGLAEFLHLAPNGKNLKKIKEALCRLQMTSIVSTNAITKKTDSGEFVTKSAEGYLSFFSKLQFIFSSSTASDDPESSKNLSFAQIHTFFINNFMRQYCGKIDLNLTLKLKQPASLGLYLMLCSRQVNEKGEILLSLPNLIDDIPLDPSKTKVAEYDRILDQSFAELMKYGVIESCFKKEREKGTFIGEKKLDRIYFLVKISREVREIQLVLFPESPKYDDSFEFDPVLTQMIALSGLDKETAAKIMKSPEFEMSDLTQALEITAYNTIHGHKEIKNPEVYLKALARKKASLDPVQKKSLEKSLKKFDPRKPEQLPKKSTRPIPKTEEELTEYLINLGMWSNEAKNICRNQDIKKITLQINGWLIKHEGEDLKDHVKELASACKSPTGYETFNRTPIPESEFQEEGDFFILGYSEHVNFKRRIDAEEFCKKHSILFEKIYLK